MQHNKDLVNIILDNTPLKKGRMIVLNISPEIRAILRASKSEYVNMYVIAELNEAVVMMDVYKFGFNEKVEEFDVSYNLVPFSILIDKEQTTKDDVFVLECKVVDEDDEICQIFSKNQSTVEKAAKHFIQLTLFALNNFIKQHSNNLTIKDFGYINFET